MSHRCIVWGDLISINRGRRTPVGAHEYIGVFDRQENLIERPERIAILNFHMKSGLIVSQFLDNALRNARCYRTIKKRNRADPLVTHFLLTLHRILLFVRTLVSTER